MVRWPMIVGASLFVAGAVIAFLTLFSQLPNFSSVSVVWFVVGLIMATVGYLITVVENYLRYRTMWGDRLR